MSLTELFRPIGAQTTRADRADRPTPTLMHARNEIVPVPKEVSKDSVHIGTKCGLPLSALSALVPLAVPFIDGARYSEAGATDRNRLDLYVADVSGPWVRRHGALMRYDALEVVA
jgi:hypothetical protein